MTIQEKLTALAEKAIWAAAAGNMTELTPDDVRLLKEAASALTRPAGGSERLREALTEIRDSTLCAAESAAHALASPQGAEPHCSSHPRFDIDCIDCSDALHKQGAEQRQEDRFEQFVQAGIARSPEPLRELGEYLGRVLEEDEFPTADRLLLQLATAYATPHPDQAASQGDALPLTPTIKQAMVDHIMSPTGVQAAQVSDDSMALVRGQARAWEAVVDVLDRVLPDWNHADGTCSMDRACNVIRKLAGSAAHGGEDAK